MERHRRRRTWDEMNDDTNNNNNNDDSKMFCNDEMKIIFMKLLFFVPRIFLFKDGRFLMRCNFNPLPCLLFVFIEFTHFNGRNIVCENFFCLIFSLLIARWKLRIMNYCIIRMLFFFFLFFLLIINNFLNYMIDEMEWNGIMCEMRDDGLTFHVILWNG